MPRYNGSPDRDRKNKQIMKSSLGQGTRRLGGRVGTAVTAGSTASVRPIRKERRAHALGEYLMKFATGVPAQCRCRLLDTPGDAGCDKSGGRFLQRSPRSAPRMLATAVGKQWAGRAHVEVEAYDQDDQRHTSAGYGT